MPPALSGSVVRTVPVTAAAALGLGTSSHGILHHARRAASYALRRDIMCAHPLTSSLASAARFCPELCDACTHQSPSRHLAMHAPTRAHLSPCNAPISRRATHVPPTQHTLKQTSSSPPLQDLIDKGPPSPKKEAPDQLLRARIGPPSTGPRWQGREPVRAGPGPTGPDDYITVELRFRRLPPLHASQPHRQLQASSHLYSALCPCAHGGYLHFIGPLFRPRSLQLAYTCRFSIAAEKRLGLVNDYRSVHDHSRQRGREPGRINPS
ncbi:hypothetical protein CDD83_2082 [Cordyceps sp. RAO-2017]|nr:hypothetical protein CDD83_2082 [Cordyceps sp. RAO-2017]